MGCVIGKNSPVENKLNAEDDGPRPPVKQQHICHSLSLVEVDDHHGIHRLELEKRQHGSESYFHSYSVGFPSLEGSKLDPHTRNQKGWPPWLVAAAGEAINDFTPRSANTFEKIDKIGQGTYSNVYKARDCITGKVVALKKVRFEKLDAQSVKFMAREILVLHRLRGHPNVIKLEGVVTSRLSTSLYLVFEYMDHDLSGLLASEMNQGKFSESQVKCYMKQLLSGLDHCHKNGVLHRDIKGSNLLIDHNGILKLADFGLATFYNPDQTKTLTSKVVTLWYRPPELLLGATSYGVGVDLWSAGCILAELLAGKPILPGRTEVEQLHRIFKLCGSPSDEYWKKYKLPNTRVFKPQQPYKCRIEQVFKDLPPSSLSLIESLLSIDPAGRGTASAALNSQVAYLSAYSCVVYQLSDCFVLQFFATEPYACEPSSLPKYPPSKEMDLKLKDEAAAAARRRRGHSANSGATRAVRGRGLPRAVPVPQPSYRLGVTTIRGNGTRNRKSKSKSEKFPPPHQDGAVEIKRRSS